MASWDLAFRCLCNPPVCASPLFDTHITILEENFKDILALDYSVFASVFSVVGTQVPIQNR